MPDIEYGHRPPGGAGAPKELLPMRMTANPAITGDCAEAMRCYAELPGD